MTDKRAADEMEQPQEAADQTAQAAAGSAPAEAAPGGQYAPSAAGKDVQPSPAAPDYYGQLLRLKAEFENYRKRVDRDRPEWIKMGEIGLLQKLIPLYDVLLQAHDQVVKASESAGSSKELVKGLEMIFKEFTKVFDSAGVKTIESVGKPYHHDLHEVLGAVETDAHPEGTVVEELQRGYTFQGKVLRPARVRIAKPRENK